MDAMRYDQFMELNPLFSKIILLKWNRVLSLLPSATPLFKKKMRYFQVFLQMNLCDKYPKQKQDMIKTGSLNNHEKEFLNDQMNQNGLLNKKMHYHKILDCRWEKISIKN